MKNDKRELILNSAENLMLSVADTDISISMIAKEAGIAKGGIYYYFKSKEEIMYAVLKRAYRRAILDYSELESPELPALEKIKLLFRSIIQSEFSDSQQNILRSLHINESVQLHNFAKLIAIQEISPVLEKILIQGKDEGIIHLKVTPYEISEMIVAVLTFLLDGTIFSTEKSDEKLKLFSKVLDICLDAKPGTFSFISSTI